MGQEIVSQKVKRTCDGCGKSQVYQMVNPSDGDMLAMTAWYVAVREVWIEGRGLQKLNAMACSPQCLETAAMKLVVNSDEPAIDLASLRTAN